MAMPKTSDEWVCRANAATQRGLEDEKAGRLHEANENYSLASQLRIEAVIAEREERENVR